MTEASTTGLSTETFGRYQPPTSLFARIGAVLAAVAEALAEAQKMRREARRRYPHLSNDL